MNPPLDVIAKALQICVPFVKNWPEDEWYSVDEDWDLNLFKTDVDNHLRASLYPAEDNETETTWWFTLLDISLGEQEQHED